MASESEILGILGRIHVLLRRAANRITDIEYMLVSPDYAREIIKLSEKTGNAELLHQCGKLRVAMALDPEKPPREEATQQGDTEAERATQRYLFSLR